MSIFYYAKVCLYMGTDWYITGFLIISCSVFSIRPCHLDPLGAAGFLVC